MAAAPVTLMATRLIKPGCEAEFAVYAKRLEAVIESFPGCLGATLVMPAPGNREAVLLSRFSDDAAAQVWVRSDERQALIAQSAHMADSQVGLRALNGMETWFAVPGGEVVRPPLRWKMWLLSASAVYVLLTGLTLVAGPTLVRLAPPLRFALIVPVLSALLTWWVMPMLSRLCRRWLYG